MPPSAMNPESTCDDAIMNEVNVSNLDIDGNNNVFVGHLSDFAAHEYLYKNCEWNISRGAGRGVFCNIFERAVVQLPFISSRRRRKTNEITENESQGSRTKVADIFVKVAQSRTCHCDKSPRQGAIVYRKIRQKQDMMFVE